MFLNDGNLLDDEIKLFVSVLCSLQSFSFIPWECAMQNVAFTMLLKIMGSSYKQLSIHFRGFWELFVVNSNFILYLSNKYYVCMWKVSYCWSKEVQNLEKKVFFHISPIFIRVTSCHIGRGWLMQMSVQRPASVH